MILMKTMAFGQRAANSRKRRELAIEVPEMIPDPSVTALAIAFMSHRSGTTKRRFRTSDRFKESLPYTREATRNKH